MLRLPLCRKAQKEFGLYCEADIVPKTLLYGGKIAAALSRQHPRDLFDIKYMDIPFTYVEYEETRQNLIKSVHGLLNENDKRFLISFEMAEPDWEHFEYKNFEKYPSVQWKLLNLNKLKMSNPKKLKNQANKLKEVLHK